MPLAFILSQDQTLHCIKYKAFSTLFIRMVCTILLCRNQLLGSDEGSTSCDCLFTTIDIQGRCISHDSVVKEPLSAAGFPGRQIPQSRFLAQIFSIPQPELLSIPKSKKFRFFRRSQDPAFQPLPFCGAGRVIAAPAPARHHARFSGFFLHGCRFQPQNRHVSA